MFASVQVYSKLNWPKFSLFKKDAYVCCLVKNIHNTHDHQNLYETCAKARRYEDHVTKKSFALEHTKSLFNKRGKLSLENFCSPLFTCGLESID